MKHLIVILTVLIIILFTKETYALPHFCDYVCKSKKHDNKFVQIAPKKLPKINHRVKLYMRYEKDILNLELGIKKFDKTAAYIATSFKSPTLKNNIYIEIGHEYNYKWKNQHLKSNHAITAGLIIKG